MRLFVLAMLTATITGCAANLTNDARQSGVPQEAPSISDIYAKAQTRVEWPEGLEAQATQAVAILQSYETDANECAIALRIYGRGRLPENRKAACYKSLEIGISGSRYAQAMKKLLEASKYAEKADLPLIESGVNSAKSCQRHWAFIRERLIN